MTDPKRKFLFFAQSTANPLARRRPRCETTAFRDGIRAQINETQMGKLAAAMSTTQICTTEKQVQATRTHLQGEDPDTKMPRDGADRGGASDGG